VFVLTTGCWYPTLTTAGLRRRIMYQTRHTFASNALAAGEAPSWVATMLGHTSPEMLFSVYARYIPNRTRRDGKCVAGRMTARTDAEATEPVGPAVLPRYSR
jgi:integrase